MSNIKAKLTFATGLHCDAALVEIDSNSAQMVIDDIYDCGVYDWIAYNLEIEIPKCSILTINVDVTPSFWGGDIDEINYSIAGNVDVKSINNHDRMVEEIAELKGAIEAAVRIKELWLPTIAFSDNPPEHYAEIEALHKMANKFERALAKLSKDK